MRDYYDVLGVSPHAEEGEIKAAYRKAALKYHPDRNFGNVEEATRDFADVQTAYEILSDANERAWYDRHKESILRGDALAEGSYGEQDIEGLTAEQLMPFFSKASSAPLDDSTHGFFTTFRKLFDSIISEESEACAQQGIDPQPHPSFGGSNSDDDVVRKFYAAWSGFNSDKTFTWAEQYAYHRAPDRRVRRAMEKENVKARQTERKEYNEVVHKLVSQIKKRDYRFISKPQVSAAQRQQDLLAARKAQSEASRAANKSNMADFAEQDWQKVDDKTLAEEEMQAFDEWETEIECVACSKTFKSEKQYAAHEKSKKHIQTVKRLKWEMKKEAKALGLEYDSDDSFATADQGSDDGIPSTDFLESDQSMQSGEKETQTDHQDSPSTLSSLPSTKAPSIISDDEYASREEVEARLETDLTKIEDLGLSDPEDIVPQIPQTKSPKKKKQKQKDQARKKNRG